MEGKGPPGHITVTTKQAQALKKALTPKQLRRFAAMYDAVTPETEEVEEVEEVEHIVQAVQAGEAGEASVLPQQKASSGVPKQEEFTLPPSHFVHLIDGAYQLFVGVIQCMNRNDQVIL